MAGKKKEEVKLENNVTEGVMLTPELLAQLTAQITEQVKASMGVENKKVEKKEVVVKADEKVKSSVIMDIMDILFNKKSY